MVSELRVAALGLYGPGINQKYPLIPTCSTLHCGIRVVGCIVGPGWDGKKGGHSIGPRWAELDSHRTVG